MSPKGTCNVDGVTATLDEISMIREQECNTRHFLEQNQSINRVNANHNLNVNMWHLKKWNSALYISELPLMLVCNSSLMTRKDTLLLLFLLLLLLELSYCIVD